MSDSYLDCPAGYALTKSEAYKIAKDRHDAHSQEVRKHYKGIQFQGSYGNVEYVDWDALPKATKR